jgi:hypothetical protein
MSNLRFCLEFVIRDSNMLITIGIDDYATKSNSSIVKMKEELTSPEDALPTLAHCVLTSMEREGLIHCLVQQNHDGLPQKV